MKEKKKCCAKCRTLQSDLDDPRGYIQWWACSVVDCPCHTDMYKLLDKIKEHQAAITALRGEIRVLVDTSPLLSPKEKMVLRKRYCLTYTYEQVGKEMGVTRERIRQIEAKAIERLRTSEL